MKYGLTRPCGTCPFVRANKFHLRPARLEEIRDCDGEFPCHNTVDYEADEDGDPEEWEEVAPPWRDTSTEHHCLGHLVVSWSDWKAFNKVAGMAARCGLFDPHALPSPGDVDVFETWDEMIDFMEELEEAR